MRTPIQFEPGSNSGEFQLCAILIQGHHTGRTMTIGDDLNDHAPLLKILVVTSQHFLRSGPDNVDFPANTADIGAMLGGNFIDAQKCQQHANRPLSAMPVMAFESTATVLIRGLKAGSTGIILTGMLIDPRADDVMNTTAKRFLIQPLRFERLDHGILISDIFEETVLRIVRSGLEAT